MRYKDRLPYAVIAGGIALSPRVVQTRGPYRLVRYGRSMYLAVLIPDSHCIAHDDQRVTRLTFHVKHDLNSFRAAR